MSEALQHQALRIEMLRIDGIRSSPSNPRKVFRDIDGLAANIKERGLKVPLRVRPIAESELASAHFEIVFGERRWRAAKLAGLLEVPAIVEEMTDSEALELMLVELAQTSGVHPVEEADAYLRLHAMKRKPEDEGGMSVEEIAAKVGLSESHVYGRMKLANLDEAVRKETLEGDLPATLALAIARVSPALQVEAMKAVRPIFQTKGWRPYREAVSILRQKFMLSLAEAPWDLKDDQLVVAAGSCAKCPKRSGNQPELFGGEKVAKDTCLDPACYAEKKSAYVALRIKTAQDTGKPVLSTTEAKKIVGQHGEIKSSEYVDLDKKDWFNDKLMTLREKLGKKAPESILAPTPNGIVDLVLKEDVDKILGRDKEKQRQATENEKYRKENARKAAANVQQMKIRALVFGEIVRNAEAAEFSKGMWFEIAGHLLETAFEYDPPPEEVLIRRLGQRGGKKDGDSEQEMEQLRAAMAKMSLEQLRGFVVELLLAQDYEYDDGQKGLFSEMQRMYGIDEKRIAQQFKDAEKAQEKHEAKKAAGDEPVGPKKKAMAKPKIIKKAAPKAAKKKGKKK